MNETRPDSVALHALARRERSRLMAHLAGRLLSAVATWARAALVADRAPSRTQA